MVEIPGLHVEVKRTEKLSLYPAIEQATRDAEPDEVPLVLHRRNARPWLVILNLEDLMKLVRAIEHGTQTVPEGSD